MALEPQKVQDQTQPPPKKDDGTPSPKPGEQNLDPKGDKGSIYKDVGLEDPPAQTVWAPNWREEFALGDDGKPVEARLNMLKRFQSPKDMFKSLEAAQQRIRSGEYKRVQAPDPKDEAAYTEWRKENEIPLDPKEYGLVPEGEAAKSLPASEVETLAEMQTLLHTENVPLPLAKKLAAGLTAMEAKRQERQAEADGAARDMCEDTLIADWGKDYRANLQANKAVLAKHFGEDAESILEARLPDGRRLVDIPAFSKGVNAWARLDGTDIFVDGDNKGGSSLESRKLEIEKIMQTDFAKYQHDPKMPTEYAEILSKLESRGKL